MNNRILEFDVIICGAGPAGSTAAFLLAKKGLRVALIDKEVFPRDKLCGGLLTKKSYNLIDSIFGINFLRQETEFFSNRFEVYYGRTKIISSFSKKLFLYVDRKKFDFAILKKAIESGAYFFEKTKVVDIDVNNLLVFTNNNTFKGRYIVAADGVNSIIRSSLVKNEIIDIREYKDNLTLAMEFYDYKFTTDRASLYFGFTKFGYGWIFPNKERTIVGMGALISKNNGLIKKQFNNFLNSIGYKEPTKVFSHLIPTGWIPNRVGFNNILLVGDAGGFVDPITGEGIYYAVRTGQVATDAILISEKNKLFAEINYERFLDKMLKDLRNRKRYRNIVFGTKFRLFIKIFLLVQLIVFRDKILDFIHEPS
ncbi:geranylgeranyl reductase [Thermodesulfobium narugense DSM 14796]|uniref:Geranylgeranyl reductase n=1 Tax=Thermodesulfobium narugense DSM 14796 TaxID=747365 RepID=M1E6M3_9BACT|nr:geranylgeranyl reductase family protein [Thermodesulfobium narugense]AEE14095.1 geranylgeranyl reductase [Thermodesulfobium narugense DSM 14796]